MSLLSDHLDKKEAQAAAQHEAHETAASDFIHAFTKLTKQIYEWLDGEVSAGKLKLSQGMPVRLNSGESAPSLVITSRAGRTVSLNPIGSAIGTGGRATLKGEAAASIELALASKPDGKAAVWCEFSPTTKKLGRIIDNKQNFDELLVMFF